MKKLTLALLLLNSIGVLAQEQDFKKAWENTNRASGPLKISNIDYFGNYFNPDGYTATLLESHADGSSNSYEAILYYKDEKLYTDNILVINPYISGRLGGIQKIAKIVFKKTRELSIPSYELKVNASSEEDIRYFKKNKGISLNNYERNYYLLIGLQDGNLISRSIWDAKKELDELRFSIYENNYEKGYITQRETDIARLTYLKKGLAVDLKTVSTNISRGISQSNGDTTPLERKTLERTINKMEKAKSNIVKAIDEVNKAMTEN
ncbi:MAG: hypothetical protein CMP52_04210 [Flavobacteriales bacterium]|jgi:hypothetical protein|nr:hypothetical protein [Candidatus Arcticimaribacter sp.]|tara:strand:- start:6732 stop:7526 length:795 start_codon:yes stop_codon:yes gene_type:complete